MDTFLKKKSYYLHNMSSKQPNLFGYLLPNNIVNLIFEFDPTYTNYGYKKCLFQLSRGVGRKYYFKCPINPPHWIDKKTISLESRMIHLACWVDSQYVKLGNSWEYVYFDKGQILYIDNDRPINKKLMLNSDGLYQPYSWEYCSCQRDWSLRAVKNIMRYRIRDGLPLYTDKARYSVMWCVKKNINIVSQIIKNIKEWDDWERKGNLLC